MIELFCENKKGKKRIKTAKKGMFDMALNTALLRSCCWEMVCFLKIWYSNVIDDYNYLTAFVWKQKIKKYILKLPRKISCFIGLFDLKRYQNKISWYYLYSKYFWNIHEVEAQEP